MTRTQLEQNLAGVCQQHPERVQRLLDYYFTGASGQWLRHAPVPEGDDVDPAADRAARAVFALPGGCGQQIPRRPDGGFDWGHVPPVSGGDGLADNTAALQKDNT